MHLARLAPPGRRQQGLQETSRAQGLVPALLVRKDLIRVLGPEEAVRVFETAVALALLCQFDAASAFVATTRVACS